MQKLLEVIRSLSQQNIDLAKRVGATEAKAQILSEKLQLLEAPKEKKKSFWSRLSSVFKISGAPIEIC